MAKIAKANNPARKTGMAASGKNPPGFEVGGPPKGIATKKSALHDMGSKPETKSMMSKKRGERGSMKKESVSPKKIRK